TSDTKPNRTGHLGRVRCSEHGRDAPEKPVDLGLGAQARDAEAAQLDPERPPGLPVVAQRVYDHRVRRVQDVAPALAVAVPELLLVEKAPGRTAAQPSEPDVHRKIQPDDQVGGLRDDVSYLAAVRTVDDPALA